MAVTKPNTPIINACPCVQQDYYNGFGADSAPEGVLDVDPHVSAAPVFFQLNGGGGKRMVVPVSYFFTNGRR